MVENLEVYESVKRWTTKLEAKSRSLDFEKSSTKRAGFYWLKEYCNFLKTSPDTLIKERMQQIQSDNILVKGKQEEYFEEFIVYLRRQEYAPNSIATATGLIRSWYKANRVPLVEVSTVKTMSVRDFKVPTVKDLRKMCDIAELPIRTWMLCQAESGLGNIDLLSINTNTSSSEFGTIKTQLKKGTIPIHIEIRRQKTMERTDSFWGPNAVEALNEYIDLGNSKIFRSPLNSRKLMSIRYIQDQVKNLAIRSKVATKDRPITPYKLRDYFNTYMKLAGVNESIVERMMGHNIGRVRSAYLVTGRDDRVTGIPISELARVYMEAYPYIDIKNA